jgi:pimeloyl-ACP methyl ester carboxylesterase
MSTAQVNGQRLYFEDSGGDGPAVLLSHGFLMDHEMFAPQVDVLAGAFRVITWDQRGHGETPSTGPFTYWDSADDALGLLDHLGVGRAVFGGMSQGGFISLRGALRAPERVRGLVLIDTQAGVEIPEAVPGYDAMHDEWLANGPSDVQDVVAAIILGPGCDPAPWLAKWAALPREDLTAPYRCLMDRDDITDRLGEITSPAIIFHGAEDAAIPMARAEALRDGLADCRDLVVVPGAGHAANLGRPDVVNPPLEDFLASLG